MDPSQSASAPKTAAGSVSLAQFVQTLVESTLLPAAEVERLAAAAPPDQDARAFAQSLVKQKKLTAFQAAMIYQGKARGLILGGYVILEKLGQGGMGTVYKAKHKILGRLVAIKVLPPAVSKNPLVVQRFQREVQAAAQLDHPNIVRAIDADKAGSVHFLVMECVEGHDLARTVKLRGPLAVGQAVNCARQAATGLAAAHAAGVIHRDIKPSNLLLDGKGCVKVLDLGLARMDVGNAPTADGTGDEITKSGSILGTIDYMAPEQAVNTRRADHRSDVYSLGCTLYFLLTGQSMYRGETPMEKLLAHREAPIPPLQELRPDVSADLEALYQRLVAKKPEQRPQSMTEVVAALDGLGGEDGKRNTALRGIAAADAGPTSAVALDETHADFASSTGASFRRPLGKAGLGWWLVGGAAAAALVLLAGVMILVLGRPGSTAVVPVVTAAKSTAGAPPGQDDAWIQSVGRLQPAEQVEAVARRLRDMNPGFDGKVARRIDSDGVVARIEFPADHVTNLAPLRALPKLKEVSCNGSAAGKGKLADLTPLQGMPLERVECGWTEVADLAPLAGMPLKYLNCGGTKVASLAPLARMPLLHLHCPGCPIRDFTPLQGMKLTYCSVANTSFNDLTLLAGMPLKTLMCFDTAVRDLQPAAGLTQLTQLHVHRTPVRDLTPLADLPLTNLDVGMTKAADLAPLKKLQLTWFSCMGTAVTDLTPLTGMPLEHLDIRGTSVVDLAPLRTMRLRNLNYEPKTDRDQETVRALKTLLSVNGLPQNYQWVLRWRVLSPLAFEAAPPFQLSANGAVAEADLERKFAASDGQTIGWRTLPANATGYVSLASVARASAFAYATIDSPTDREATLLVGSDDGVAVWLNGAKVHEARTARAWKIDSDRIAVRLRKGANSILIRCDNITGTWGFSVGHPGS